VGQSGHAAGHLISRSFFVMVAKTITQYASAATISESKVNNKQKWQSWWQQHQTQLFAVLVGYIGMVLLHGLVNLTVPSGRAVLDEEASAQLGKLDVDLQALNQAATMLHERKLAAQAAAAQGLTAEQAPAKPTDGSSTPPAT